MKLKALALMLSSLFLIACEKDKDPALNPEYGPVESRQYGSITANVQELSFNSNGFRIVGDFRAPLEGMIHPAIIMVHGSGGATREGAVDFEPLIEIFLRNGFAVLSWDKPGSGESTGEFTQGYTLTGRAGILADAVKVLLENASVDHSSIGLWGISQAGWVMPMALDKTGDVAFMIVVSGGAEDGIEQMAYQIAQVVACKGGSEEQVNAADQNWAKMAKATVYKDYRDAVEILVNIPGVYEHTGLTLTPENQWNPWPREIDAFFDPMEVMERTTIPLLVFFGEHDKNIDPVHGAQAYENALQKAGNQNYAIVTLKDAGHVLTPAVTGCMNEPVSSEWVAEYLDTLESWIQDQAP